MFSAHYFFINKKNLKKEKKIVGGKKFANYSPIFFPPNL
jgi:hypothetical protein